MKKNIVTAIIAASVFAINVDAQTGAKSKKPNIIFIVADDLGYGNLTSFNATSKIPTPNIDKIGKEGTKFTNFYSGSTVCAPSRCALMTGKTMGHSYIRGNSAQPIREQDTTLAQRLQANGYATGMYGKWGLGEENTAGSPERKGFDEFYGYLNQTHAHNYFTSYLYEVKNRQIKQVKVDSAQYAEDLIINHALDFVQANKDKPFFLYLPLTIPHAELRVPDNLMKPFLNADGTSKFEPEKPFAGQNQYDPQPKPHAAFAAMITKLDSDVGQVLDLIKKLGLDDNTYVFFTSDNGPHKEGGGDPEYFNSNGPLRGIKRDLYEGGIRVPMLVKAPGKIPAGKTNNVSWAFWDILPTIAQITNTPSPANIDGLSFVAALQGKTQKQHDYLYWQFNEGKLKEALIKGEWKLIRFKEKGKPEELELYNLSKDIGETNNLAASNAAKVQELKALLAKAKTPAENKKFDWSEEEL
ncbi:MAG TPA: arylsulfatase [Segetibacter sp.]|jgi:arylsulfatase A-like enzyme